MLHGFNILRQQYSQLSKPGGANQSAINTIQTLADRLSKADDSQLSIEDRRAAVLALKGLSRDHNRAVGQHALPALLTSLQRDAKDEDIARALIECCITLCEVQSPDAAQPSSANHQQQAQNKRKQQEQGPPSGLQHTDIFLQEPGPLHCLLPLLAPDRAFYTRFASLQLLGSLLRNRPHRVQDHILVAPGGCGAILECLAEGAGSSAEIVRNEALLLLPHLVYGNADIQKLVAFEGAFEKLLDVCAAEGRIEGGVIVQDALEGLEALLRYNVSNQNYFRETFSIPMLAPLLFYPPTPANNEFPSKHAEHEYARQLEAFCFQDWDHQKVVNAKIVLDITALLIGGQGEGRRANQNALLQCGMTKCLLDLALGSTAPASLKTQALHVSASLMQASRANQDLLSTLLVQPVKLLDAAKQDASPGPEGEQQQPPQDPAYAAASTQPSFTRAEPRPAAVSLVETAIGTSGAKGGLGLRSAAITCFRAYAITQSPSTHATSDNADAYKHLVSAMLFSYLVRSSETAKAAARSIAINPDGTVVKHVRTEKEGDDDDDDDDDAPSSLIQVIVGNLTLSERELADAVRKERASAMGATVFSTSYSAADWTRIMVGYLVLLSVWLHDSPLSVRDFLSESATLQAVVQPVAQSSGVDPLIQGLAAFLLGVAYEFDTDPGKAAVTRATMHPILHSRIGADQFAVRINRIAEDDKEKADEEAQDKDLEVNGLGHLSKRRRAGLWFDWSFVEFWRANSTLIAKSITVDPASSSAAQAALPAELLDAQRQAEALRDTVAKQAREIEVLEKRVEELTETHSKQIAELQSQLDAAQEAVTTHAPQLEAARTELKQIKSSHTSVLADLQSKHDELQKLLGESQAREEESNGKVLQLTSEMARISAGKPSAKEFGALQKAHDELKKKHDDLLASSASNGEGGGSGAVKDLMEARELASQRAEKIAELEDKITSLESATGATPSASAAAAAVAAGGEETKELQAKLEALEAEKAKFESQAALLPEVKAELEAATAQLATLPTLTQAKSDLESKVAALESEISTSKATSQSADAEQAKQLEAATREKELESKLAQLQAVEKEKSTLEGKIKELSKVGEEKKELEGKLKAMDKLQTEKKALEGKVEDLEKLTKENKDLSSKVKQLDLLTKEKKELETKLSTLSKIESDKKGLEDQLSALKQSHEKETTDLKSKLTTLKKQASSNAKPAKGGKKDAKSDESEQLEKLTKEKEEISKENEDLLVLLEELTQKPNPTSNFPHASSCVCIVLSLAKHASKLVE
ncbi:hypothetical protein [Sporisorium scitamineum]|uniref:Vesicle tethering protein Uso1/P115-like head domain-containing protein n=1 Tax=Sporisorium scitamineum TaxID=49012 RepID=A0A0F7RV38_9BASI|nr:hypothetical protein [Sporisorium scitamineum]